MSTRGKFFLEKSQHELQSTSKTSQKWRASGTEAWSEEREYWSELARFGFERCVAIDESAYAGERRALRDSGRLPSASRSA